MPRQDKTEERLAAGRFRARLLRAPEFWLGLALSFAAMLVVNRWQVGMVITVPLAVGCMLGMLWLGGRLRAARGRPSLWEEEAPTPAKPGRVAGGPAATDPPQSSTGGGNSVAATASGINKNQPRAAAAFRPPAAGQKETAP